MWLASGSKGVDAVDAYGGPTYGSQFRFPFRSRYNYRGGAQSTGLVSRMGSTWTHARIMCALKGTGVFFIIDMRSTSVESCEDSAKCSAGLRCIGYGACRVGDPRIGLWATFGRRVRFLALKDSSGYNVCGQSCPWGYS